MLQEILNKILNIMEICIHQYVYNILSIHILIFEIYDVLLIHIIMIMHNESSSEDDEEISHNNKKSTLWEFGRWHHNKTFVTY